MTQQHTTHAQALGYLSGRPLTPFSSVALKLVVALVKWEHLRRSRNHLRILDDHLLDDIGVTRELARKEATRSFWQE